MTDLETELRRLAAEHADGGLQSRTRIGELRGQNMAEAYTHAADLTREHEAKRDGGWMPIESAPRDEGVQLIVMQDGRRFVAEWDDAAGQWQGVQPSMELSVSVIFRNGPAGFTASPTGCRCQIRLLRGVSDDD